MRKITKVKRSIRAISPVISVLLMIAIAVAAALVAYAWVSGYMDVTTTKTGKAIQIQSVSNNPPAVYVQNVGDSEVTLKSCYINGNLDPLASNSINGEKLAKSQTQEILQFTNLNAFSALQIKIKIVTTDGVAAEIIKTFTGPTINNPENPTTENIPPFAVLHWSASGLTVNLDASGSSDSDGTIDSYVWTSNGAQIGTTATFSHTFATEGTYTIRLTITDDDDATGYAQRIITVNTIPPANAAPNAEFTYSPLDPQTGETITFTDGSTDSDGTIASWAWVFGDGTTSNTRNPTKTYTTAGTYTVTLTVTDNNGATDQLERPITVTAAPPANNAPVADFTFLPTNPLVGQTVTFTDGSSDSDGTIVSWAWTFGDGATSNNRNPSRIYSAANTYTVTLTVTDNDGETDTQTKQVTVTSPPPANNAPVTDFTFAPSNPETGTTITFTDASTDSDGTVTGWSWNFGDGTTSTQQNPTKAYTTASTFTVTLTVTDDDGATDTQTKQVTVTAPNVAPVADFIYTPTNPETGTTVTFTDASTDTDGTITSWAWNFGDTTTSNVQNPTKAYAAAGTYTVTLTVTDNDGATNTQTKQITVNTPNSAPTAAFTWDTNGLTVDFDGSDSVDSDGTIVSYVWTSDGTQIGTGETLSYTYSVAGTYTVRLTVTDDDGATNYVEHSVTVTTTLTGQIHPEWAYYYRGGQSYLSGPLSDMRTSDDDYYVSYSETGSSTVPRIEYYCSFDIDDIHVSESRITKLSITLEGHYTTSVNQKLYIFNLHTGMWELQTTNMVGTTDTPTTFTVDSHISNYINSANGEIYILIETYAGALPYHHYNDLFQVTATYTP
ncbi:MAG: PKD domain-containing protein [Candidatus Bathyarchaeia archaeon]|jgi:PKD repeat protein/FlaG/FlaF family flagellin (archaellin)